MWANHDVTNLWNMHEDTYWDNNNDPSYDNYENSYINASLNLGVYFGAFDKLKKFKFFRYFGMEFDFNYIQFTGKEVNRVVSDLQSILFGFNAYMRTNFQFPLNLIFRVGVGLTYSIQKYTKYDGLGDPAFTGKLESLDFYYKPEIAVEFRAASMFYIELGVGFISILYKDEIMYSLKPTIMLGFTFK